MQIRVLGCYGGESRDCHTTCLLINEALALDAGSLTRVLSLEQQLAIRTIVLSHAHVDHTSCLPFFVENSYGALEAPVDVYAGSATIAALRSHLFNGEAWPDFTRLPNASAPAVRFHEIRAGEPFELAGVSWTPIPVYHPVPTFGFLLADSSGSVLWSSDTGPTDELWQAANRATDLKAVCLDTSFDNALQKVADASGHLTPLALERELEKLERKVPVLLHHLKPPSVARIREEVRRLGNPDLGYLEQGESYDFS